MICHNCEGDGYVESIHPSYGAESPNWVTSKCETCHGSGDIEPCECGFKHVGDLNISNCGTIYNRDMCMNCHAPMPEDSDNG